MKLLSTKAHGVLDYLVGALMIAAPWMFGFANGGAETWVFVALGVAAFIYSLITNYEFGVAKLLSMKTHLAFDTISGLLLAASPWIFDFAEDVFWPHLIFGLLELGVVVLTDPVPYKTLNGSKTPLQHA